MKMKVLSFWILAGWMGMSSLAWADEFDALWEKAQKGSHSIQAEEKELEAAQIAARRSRAALLPRLIAEGQWYSTNDPANSLFSTLSSRSLLASDLSPDRMNEPPREAYRRGALRLDWTLFEGGARRAAVRGKDRLLDSRKQGMESQSREEFADFAGAYAKLISLRAEVDSYETLRDRLKTYLSRYRLGSKDNPVGYSGLLGMRSLLNRLEGELDQSRSEAASIQKSIQIRTRQDSLKVSLPSISTQAFIDQKLPLGSSREASSRVRQMQLGADAALEFSRAERARWMPRVGVFALTQTTSGPRQTGGSQEYGAYLQWEIFNPSNLGAYREASLRAQGDQARADAMAQRIQIQNDNLENAIPALRENLKRVNDSFEITTEQVGVTERLFGSGSINALQFVEVLSRRADVVQSRKRLEHAYIDAVAARFAMEGAR